MINKVSSFIHSFIKSFIHYSSSVRHCVKMHECLSLFELFFVCNKMCEDFFKAVMYLWCVSEVCVLSQRTGPHTQLLNDNKKLASVINDKRGVPVCFLCAEL